MQEHLEYETPELQNWAKDSVWILCLEISADPSLISSARKNIKWIQAFSYKTQSTSQMC